VKNGFCDSVVSCVATLSGHSNAVLSVAFHRNVSSYLATGSTCPAPSPAAFL
jgi:hypothetical protein